MLCAWLRPKRFGRPDIKRLQEYPSTRWILDWETQKIYAESRKFWKAKMDRQEMEKMNLIKAEKMKLDEAEKEDDVALPTPKTEGKHVVALEKSVETKEGLDVESETLPEAGKESHGAVSTLKAKGKHVLASKPKEKVKEELDAETPETKTTKDEVLGVKRKKLAKACQASRLGRIMWY
jgi:hypothetical protein